MEIKNVPIFPTALHPTLHLQEFILPLTSSCSPALATWPQHPNLKTGGEIPFYLKNPPKSISRLFPIWGYSAVWKMYYIILPVNNTRCVSSRNNWLDIYLLTFWMTEYFSLDLSHHLYNLLSEQRSRTLPDPFSGVSAVLIDRLESWLWWWNIDMWNMKLQLNEYGTTTAKQ